MASIGKLKISKKLLKARASRFASEEVSEPARKVFAHATEGTVRISGDPVQKLVDLCKRKLAAGEKLTELQYDALRRYNFDPADLLIGELFQPPKRVVATPAVPQAGRKRKRPAVQATGSGPASSSTPLVILRSGSASIPSSSPVAVVKSPAVVLRQGASDSSTNEGAGSAGVVASTAASVSILLRKNGSAGVSAGAGSAIEPALSVPIGPIVADTSFNVFAGIPVSGPQRIKTLRKLVQRLATLVDRHKKGEVLSSVELSAASQREAVAAALADALALNGAGALIDLT